MNIEVRQGIQYQIRDKKGLVHREFALVIGVTEDKIVAVPVKSVSLWNGHGYQKAYVCYDESDAEYPRDKDNVRLRDCPSPFSDVTHLSGDLFAYAVLDDMKKLLIIDEEKRKKYHVEVVDDGKRISKSDMQKVLKHPWSEQKQKEKLKAIHQSGIADLECRLGFFDAVSPTDEKEGGDKQPGE